VQLAIGVTSGMRLEHILELCQVTEKHDIKRVWIGEDIAAPHDVFVSASTVLLRFKKLHVGIGVTSPLVRNVSTIARAAESLSEIGDYERFTLGLGVGGLQDLQKLGIKVVKPRDVLRNATVLLRAMWKGKTLTFNKGDFQFRLYQARYASNHEAPIFYGVRGPILLGLAGEISDGVILSGPKTYVRKAVHLVREAIKRSERPARNFKFVLWVPTVLVEKAADLKLIKKTVAFVLADTPEEVLEQAGLCEEVNEIREVYHKRGILRASKLITSHLLEEVAIHGEPRRVVEEFKAFEKSGINEVVFGPPYGAHPQTAANELAESWMRYS